MKTRIFLTILSVSIICIPAFSKVDETKKTTSKKNSEKLFCWRATDEDSTIYLLGTIHVGTEDMYPLDPKIEKAFKDSETLVLELDMANIDPAIIQQKMMYTPPDSLKNHVSEEVYKELIEYLMQYGISESTVSRMKPTMIMSMIVMLKMQEYGYNPQWGIDMYLMNTRGDKELIELETIDFQINLFEKLADSLLETELDKLSEEDEMKEMFEKMISAWKNGDAKGMEDIILDEYMESPEGKEVFKYMFVERNKGMAKKIHAMMDKPGTNFVAVGSGHMIGKEGIVSLLSKDKKVVQLKKTPVPQSFVLAPDYSDEADEEKEEIEEERKRKIHRKKEKRKIIEEEDTPDTPEKMKPSEEAKLEKKAKPVLKKCPPKVQPVRIQDI